MTWVVAGTAAAGAVSRAPVALDGAICLPVARGVGVLALAGVGGLLAARGVWRQVIGAVLALAGLGGAVALGALLATDLAGPLATLAPALDGSAAVVLERAWAGPVLCAAGLLAVIVGGVLAAVAGGRWPALGSRYDRASGAAAPVATTPGALWDALDRGEDPTEGPDVGRSS